MLYVSCYLHQGTKHTGLELKTSATRIKQYNIFVINMKDSFKDNLNMTNAAGAIYSKWLYKVIRHHSVLSILYQYLSK